MNQKIANLSFVCAVLVVAIHLSHGVAEGWSWWYDSLFRYGLFRMSVPWFFLVSGYFLSRRIAPGKMYNGELSKRFRTLVIPFFAWCTIWALWTFAVCKVWPFHGWEHLRLWGLNVFKFPPIGLWYVRALILLVIMSPALFAFARKYRGKAVLCLYVLELLVTVLPGKYKPFQMLVPVSAVVYFSAGCWLRELGGEFPVSKRTATWAAVVALVLCLSKSILQLHEVPHAIVLVHLAVPLLIVVAWGCVPKRPFHPYLVRNAFPLYILHNFFTAVFTFVFGRENANGLLCGLQFVFAVGGSLFAAEIARQCFPRMANFLFGGR